MDIWFTSDWHFNHNKDFICKNRGFSSIEEMNNVIIEHYNKHVHNDDIVYVLGDVMMGDNYDYVLSLLKKLNGKKYLAYGNHDTPKRLEFYKTNKIFEDIQMGYRVKKGKKTLIATHYPTFVNNTTNDGVWNIHGHTHSSGVLSDIPKCINVAIDAWNCYPVKMDEIMEVIKNEK